jgi:hypothetical protein
MTYTQICEVGLTELKIGLGLMCGTDLQKYVGFVEVIFRRTQSNKMISD